MKAKQTMTRAGAAMLRAVLATTTGSLALAITPAALAQTTAPADDALAADIDPFDLERVEVLRGPQGTLYGANSLGGVLRFITAAPVLGTYEVRGQAGVETIDGASGVGSSANGVVNVPIGDSVAVRASGFYRRTPGFIEASGTQPAKDINDLRRNGMHRGGRARLSRLLFGAQQWTTGLLGRAGFHMSKYSYSFRGSSTRHERAYCNRLAGTIRSG